MSSFPRVVLESWNRSAPRNDNVTRGSGGILGAMRDSRVENDGSVTGDGLFSASGAGRAMVAISVVIADPGVVSSTLRR